MPSVEEQPACFVARDQNVQALALHLLWRMSLEDGLGGEVAYER
jgi:hypothetical protein